MKAGTISMKQEHILLFEIHGKRVSSTRFIGIKYTTGQLLNL